MLPAVLGVLGGSAGGGGFSLDMSASSSAESRASGTTGSFQTGGTAGAIAPAAQVTGLVVVGIVVIAAILLLKK
jgi:hypothetical protein